MIFMLICPLIGLYSLQYFVLNYGIQGLNRAVIATPIELMYKSVSTSEETPLFNRDTFEYIVTSYYNNVLPRYSKNYELSFYYYNSLDESMCLTDYCDGVEITVKCKLTLTYNYRRVMYYEMKETANG